MDRMTTTEFAMLGLPVGHSVSPELWTRVFAAAGEPSWRYAARDVVARDLPAWFELLRAGDVAGAHITMPYKADAWHAADVLDEWAQAAGVANWLAREDGVLVGRNTDAEGAARLLAGRRFARVLVLGSGGAARALLAALRGVTDDLVIASLDESGAREAARASAASFGRVVAAPWQLPLRAADVELIVNATPLGMEGVAGDPPVALSDLGPGAYVYDLVYHRDGRVTPLQAVARARGAAVLDGVAHIEAQMTATLTYMRLAPDLAPIVGRTLAELVGRAPGRWDAQA
jgi:shikimate dehydrogenase